MTSRDMTDLGSAGYDLLDAASSLSISSHLSLLQHRITELSDYRIFGSAHENDLIHLYSNKFVEGDDQIVRCGAFDHTMFESIDAYCSQKFPVDFIKQHLLDDCRFEVHGIFPAHFPKVAARLGYTSAKQVPFRHNTRDKKFNHIRPEFFSCKDEAGQSVFVVVVNSGRDYVFHYASMLKHVIGMFSAQTADRVAVIRYPQAESSIHVWTGLDDSLVKRGDVVILGYIEEMDKRFRKDPRFSFVEEISAKHYTSIRYVAKDKTETINLLGIKFSFWGCISAKMISQICRLGAEEIIYVGKLGTLANPTDIYSRIFVPSSFLIMYHDKIVCRIDSQKNNLLAAYPEMSTGYHVSVPTVVEEDYVQRKIISDLQINSIDNEVSQMAYSVVQFNREFNAGVSFSAIHFATDYIRRPSERNLKVKFDLSNNRSKEAFKRKITILDNIAFKLTDYLEKR